MARLVGASGGKSPLARDELEVAGPVRPSLCAQKTCEQAIFVGSNQPFERCSGDPNLVGGLPDSIEVSSDFGDLLVGLTFVQEPAYRVTVPLE
jgi:hypothetical protein